jgi:flagellin-specific chaperone FliS
MAHAKCLERIKKESKAMELCDCIKDDLDILKRIDNIITELENNFLINNYNNWGSKVDQEVRNAVDVFCKLLIKEIKE